MSEPTQTKSVAGKRGQGFWLTAGEIVGVLALIVAGLNYWDSHRQHVEEAQREQAQAVAQTAFVATGVAGPDGRHIGLRPLKTGQAIQSQRYTFPSAVSGSAHEVAAEEAHIDLDWIDSGLKQALAEAKAESSGEARVPVVIETTYVEDGDTRTDISLYQVGFSWRREFFGGRRIRLRGIALSRRGLRSDPQKAVQSLWESERRKMTSRSEIPIAPS